MPRRIAIGSAPAATFRIPCRTIACASTVAVVVPSPAISFVAAATWRTNSAPWFVNVLPSAISPATVTPSFVIVGGPVAWASTTFRPRGPERHLDGVGDRVDAGHERRARLLAEPQVSGRPVHDLVCGVVELPGLAREVVLARPSA